MKLNWTEDTHCLALVREQPSVKVELDKFFNCKTTFLCLLSHCCTYIPYLQVVIEEGHGCCQSRITKKPKMPGCQFATEARFTLVREAQAQAQMPGMRTHRNGLVRG